jgi:type I restriction enzyme, R subunit
VNQDPEQIARDKIDKLLNACGWVIQDKDKINLNAALGVVVRYYLTQDGKETDYVLFIDKKPVGVIEAKREEEGHRLTSVEEQSKEYAESKLKYLNNDPLPFVYESTGDLTRFTDFHDPKPRSRPVFTFHRPETFRTWLKTEKSLRASLLDIPVLPAEGLRDCQIKAITKLESSFKEFKPKALIQMATGSGKTFTAISFIYRLLKFTEAKRILFLVDTKNLGEQAEQEFMSFLPNDDNRKFTELYGVHRLKSSYVPSDNHVYISTIQRLYSILKGTELEEAAEEENPNESRWQPKEPMPVVYNEKLPIEFFDFIVIDECHRSIYNLWMQVIQYYDAFQIGLTATPDNRTFGYFNQNIVSEYTHEQAIADGVNVGFDVFLIETQITQQGGTIWKGEYVERREKLSRKKRWELQDEDENYTANQLDKEIVNPNQIRLIIKTFKEHLPEIFPDRLTDKGEFEIPKTLIFAKTDSHADDIINIVREEFGEGNSFCKKITYRNKDEDPKSVLAQFRNDYFPRIAVTVDMIATGTDVKPLECLLFMRDVRSRNYFEQMKGRGTRIITLDDLRKVTPTAKRTKDHFVIVDAVGVTKSIKSDSRPLEKKPGVPLKDLLGAIAVGNHDEELFSSLANRLTRLEKQVTEQEKQQFSEKAEGKTLKQVANELLQAYNPDVLDDLKAKVETEMAGESPMAKEEAFNKLHDELKERAADVFHSSDLREYIENVRRAHEQTIDITNPDTLLNKGWATDSKEKAENLVADFKTWINQHQDEITALQIFYTQPYRRRELNYKMIQEVLEKLKLERPLLAPMQVWRAYEQLEKATGSPKSELIALVSLLRRISGVDATLIDYSNKVDLNFRDWILKKNAGQHNRFTEEQMQWLRMIKDHIATSIHLDADDLDYTPFDAEGGKGKMWQLFGEQMDEIINELNEALAA